MQDGAGRWRESQASFAVGADGIVDLSTQPPVAGSYAGADAMGFLWSMRPTDDAQIDGPFSKTTVDPTVIELSAEADGRQVDSVRPDAPERCARRRAAVRCAKTA